MRAAMWKVIGKREILHNLYSLRFLLSLVLVIGVMAAGSLSYGRRQAAAMANYGEARALSIKTMQEDGQVNVSRLAVRRRAFDLRPRDNAFIDDAKEKYLPNAVIFSAWNVFGVRSTNESANPLLAKYDELTWAFVAALLVSFVALLFTFDAISGEKETKTLALELANPVPRSALLGGKFVSAVASVTAIAAVGALVSLLILIATGAAGMSARTALETLAFVGAAALLAAVMAAFGLLCSVLARSSNVSLLLALCVWLLFAVVIPNSSGFIAKTAFPIEKAEAVQKRVDKAFDDLNKAAPPGSWMSQSNNPFLPQHELRANLLKKRMAAEKAIRDDYYRTMFRQFERTRSLTAISPAASFGYAAEALVGGGYARFRKVWDDIRIYQGQLSQWFVALDAKDPKSPHWYNPNEDISTTRTKVSFDIVPQFAERPMSAGERGRAALPYAAVIAIMACFAYGAAYARFIKYDVR
jgi:ABC-type transport system involved in multi-copper enzyme maturation permease subunit